LFDNWRNAQQRGIFPPDEDDFSQAYWMYVKKNQQSMTEKDPLLGVSTIFKQALGAVIHSEGFEGAFGVLRDNIPCYTSSAFLPFIFSPYSPPFYAFFGFP